MLMIVLYHFASHGGTVWETEPLKAPYLWNNFLLMPGKVGVNIFVLISGYFLIERQDAAPSIKRILKFWGQVIFYSLGIYVLFVAFGLCEFDVKTTVKVILPITFAEWWFASTYFVMFLLHPYLNKFLSGIDKRAYQTLLILLTVCWCIVPTLTNRAFESSNLAWFFFLYALAGYVRLYGLTSRVPAGFYWAAFVVVSALTYLSSVILTLLGNKWNFFSERVEYFYSAQTITILLMSVSLFLAFANLRLKYNRWINLIASATFGIYLIHDNHFVRSWLWIDVFPKEQYQKSLMFIPYSIAVVAIVFAGCAVVDLIRKCTFEKVFMLLVDYWINVWSGPFRRVCEWGKAIVFGVDVSV